MLQTKKRRTLAVVAVVVTILCLAVLNKPRYEAAVAQTVSISQEKTLIDSHHKDSVDEAINREISKSKSEEEQGGTEQNSGDAGDAGDFDAAKEFLQIRALAPITIFSKSYCPHSRALKKLMTESYAITPQPTIVELDKHKHGPELQEYLAKVTKRRTVPNVIVGLESPESRGGNDDFQRFHNAGTLAKLLNDWGNKEISVVKVETPSNS